MRKITFILSVATAASLGYWAGKNNPVSDVAAHTTTSPIHENLKTSIVTKNLLAEKNVQRGNTTVPDKKQSPPNFELSIADQIAQHKIDAVKAEYELKQRSENFTEWLTKNQTDKPWFDLGIEMRGRFDAEDTDHDWALTEEGHIQSLFSQEQALAGIALKSTFCKSTQCQITVSVLNQDHANETIMSISKVLSGENFSHVIVDNQAQLGETVLYVARNEKGFEFN